MSRDREGAVLLGGCSVKRHHSLAVVAHQFLTDSEGAVLLMPDDLFRLAEATARRVRVSRSELYAKAIAEYLKQQDDRSITERLNHLYSRHEAKLDPGLHRAQLKSLGKDDW
jgi:hypothetical protein